MKTESTFIIHTENVEQENALKAFAKALKMKLEVSKKNSYDPKFVAKIQKSRQQAKEGKTVKIGLDDIWKE